ncbi:MAG: hypothetical protein JO176_15365 [Acidimicrobiia bacterium]|nr:hypothetical protein [Acidimicrobiia bacterium]
MPPAVDHEARRADQVHALEERRLAGQPPRRDEQVGAEDQQGARPSDDFDQEGRPAQAARFRST